MKLFELVDNTKTDKNTVHSYLELYENLLSGKKETARNVLEIGIGEFNNKGGGSLLLWRDYFKNATIYGLDIYSIENVMDELKNDTRVVLYTSSDAYNEDVFRQRFHGKNLLFDFMLDDGPHTLESMVQFIRLYSKLMTKDGIMIIEDIPSWDWIKILTVEVPENLRPFVKSYDLRDVKGRYDDIVFVIDKSV